MNKYPGQRSFMKSSQDDIDIVAGADMAKGVPHPPIEKPYSAEAKKFNSRL